MTALLRFLEFVRRELGADDVRAEIGGRAPGPGCVWAPMPGGMRLVVVFDAPPADPAQVQERLAVLVESFASLGVPEEIPTGSMRPPPVNDLQGALELLAFRARALAAVVVDERSPVVWGSSLSKQGPDDLEDALWVARVAREVRAHGLDLSELAGREPEEIRAALVAVRDAGALARDVERVREFGARSVDRDHLAAMEAMATVRAAEPLTAAAEGTLSLPGAVGPVLVRGFATIYRLVLAFEAPVSELHAEAAIIHGLPLIERLVTSLPPREPKGGGAAVAVLRRLRRV